MILLIGLLPGSIISMACFFNAMMYDNGIQSSRMSAASTDLSQVRIEDYTLGHSLPEWNTANNSWVALENGINPHGYYDATGEFHQDDYKKDNRESPIVYIYMSYPDNWKGFTIQGKPMPDFKSVTGTLGENFIFVEKSMRCGYSYTAFIDFENDLELRFNFGNEELRSITLMRVDKRKGMEFLKNRSGLYDDSLHSMVFYGDNSVFYNPNIISVLDRAVLFFTQKRFFLLSEYTSLPLYLALWIFPLVLLVYKLWKRSIKRLIILMVSIFCWYLFLIVIDTLMTAVSRF